MLSTVHACSAQEGVGASKAGSDSLSEGLTSLVTIKRDHIPQEDLLKCWPGSDASNSHDDNFFMAQW